MKHFDSVKLKQQIMQCFFSIGVNRLSLFHCAESMVQTSLRGVDSHGINLFPHYFRSFQSGRLNKIPNFAVESSHGAVSLIDADNAVGHHSALAAMDLCLENADKFGVGICCVKNSSHYGASSYFGIHGANKGFITIVSTNADALVKSFDGKKSFFGTNPICFCAPLLNEDPLCLDMATSTVSWNKIKNYRRENISLEQDWAYDNEGQPTFNPHDAVSLSPSGTYKGFGLGMMVEILCSVLTNSVISKDMLPMFNSPPEKSRQVSHFLLAINISSLMDKKMFTSNLTDMVRRVRSEESLSDQVSVRVPGDPEKETYLKRKLTGIPCHEEVYSDFIKIDKRFEKCLVA